MTASETLVPNYRHFNGRHAGETIFIIGAGPQLSRLPPETLKTLEQRVCIGLNRTTYKLSPTYFLSAYIGQVMLAQLTAPGSILIHMRPVYAPPLIPGIVALKRRMFTAESGLTRELAPPEPTLSTRLNVALGATHLAHIMGAAQIVYVGVEQQNAAHFFNYEPDLVARMRADVETLKDIPFLNVDHPYSTYESLVAKLDTEAKEEERKPFYVENHRDTFKAYFDILRQRGCRIVSAAPSSVTIEAGAAYQPLETLLATTGMAPRRSVVPQSGAQL